MVSRTDTKERDKMECIKLGYYWAKNKENELEIIELFYPFDDPNELIEAMRFGDEMGYPLSDFILISKIEEPEE